MLLRRLKTNPIYLMEILNLLKFSSDAESVWHLQRVTYNSEDISSLDCNKGLTHITKHSYTISLGSPGCISFPTEMSVYLVIFSSA